MRKQQAGAATVEFAVVLPLVAIAMLAIVQVSLLAWDHLRLAHAAREGARVLTITNDEDAAADAAREAGGFGSRSVDITVFPQDRPVGTPARLTITAEHRVVVPFIDAFSPTFIIDASVSMRVERDPP